MDREAIVEQVLATWRRHNDLLLYLVAHVPPKGFAAVPAHSRGRDVARQLEHLDRVRRGWLHYHTTGHRAKAPRDKERAPSPARLKRALQESGRLVEAFLRRGLDGEVRPRMFGRQVLRWMGYLVAHESHHRGQIMLALKQSGMRLPDRVALDGLWGGWILGK